MKYKIIHFLRVLAPWLAVLVLWRLSNPLWNPAGILAIIPIFYCSFVKPVPWFVPYAILFCFLIDYKFETLAFWTALYCLFYAINGFQTFTDITKTDKNSIHIFAIFISIGMIVLLFMNFSFINIIRAIWIVLWVCALYIPISEIIKRVQNDR